VLLCRIDSQAMLYKLDTVLLAPSTLPLAPSGSGYPSEESRIDSTVMQALRGRQVSAQSLDVICAQLDATWAISERKLAVRVSCPCLPAGAQLAASNAAAR
jgi:hypothetical protein